MEALTGTGNEGAHPVRHPGQWGPLSDPVWQSRALAATERHSGLSCPAETCSFCLSWAWEALSPTEGVCIR